MDGARIPREQTATLCLSPAPGARIPVERLRAMREATRVLGEARARADGILAAARAAAEELRAHAIEEGRAEARREAERLVAGAARAWARAHDALLPELAELAAAMARRILSAELRLRPELALEIARRVIAATRPGRSLRVRVHPGDARALAAGYRELAASLGIRLRLVPDPAVGRGGCWLQGASGEVDGRLEVQLAGLLEALQDDRGEEVPDAPERA